MANYLIDSHIFIWSDSSEHINKIHPKFREIIDNEDLILITDDGKITQYPVEYVKV